MDAFLGKSLSTSSSVDESSSPQSSASDVKSKILNVWNNIKFGKTAWNFLGTELNCSSPVWLLGQCYHRKLNGKENTFNYDFYSKIWLTYRREFEEFRGTTMRTDCGWGCMIRSGQMMLANALLLLHLKRQWRWKIPCTNIVLTGEDLHDENIHRNIIRLFGDSPSSPLSIHCLVEISRKILGRSPGDWFGPGGTSYLLRQAVNSEEDHPLLKNNLKIYVAKDCTVYKQDVIDLCSRNISEETVPNVDKTVVEEDDYSILNIPDCDTADKWIPVLILVPLRLGREKLNPIYGPCIQALLATEHCVGIIGGRPRHSLYFTGFQDDYLIHLDPHLVQDKVDVFRRNFSLNSFHCKMPRKMHIGKMDPSCCFGFLISSHAQFQGWCELTKELNIPPSTSSANNYPYPMFGIEEGKCTENSVIFDEFESSLTSTTSTNSTTSFEDPISEDFIFL